MGWDPNIKKLANRIRGRKAQRVGKSFEQMVAEACKLHGIKCHKNDAVFKQARGKAWREKNGIDFHLGFRGSAVFADGKTVDGSSYAYSSLIAHQVQELKEWNDAGFNSGILVYFREPERICFIHVNFLLSLKPREGIKFSDPICIPCGNPLNMDFRGLF